MNSDICITKVIATSVIKLLGSMTATASNSLIIKLCMISGAIDNSHPGLGSIVLVVCTQHEPAHLCMYLIL